MEDCSTFTMLAIIISSHLKNLIVDYKEGTLVGHSFECRDSSLEKILNFTISVLASYFRMTLNFFIASIILSLLELIIL